MNIIYINPDEMRADVLGCYGHALVRTPNFDRLAAQGTRFNQCHVQHTVCTPSRCSFMTGWYAHTAGHRTLWNPLQAHEPNTMRYLKEAGYSVHWLGKNDCLAPESFASSVTKIYGAGEGKTGASANVFRKGEPGFYSFLHTAMDGPPHDALFYERAIRILKDRKEGDAPFFMFLATSFPHPIYRAPEPWHSMYDPDDLPSLRPVVEAGKPDYHKLIRRSRDLDKVDESVLRKVMAVYLGMTSYVDHLLGQLLDALEETGLAQETAVVAFSDHGDWAGDYGLVEKWPSGLDDTLTRVPLIVRSPGGVEGHVVQEPVELFDIVPTTLELASIEARHTHYARSLLPQLHGAAGDPARAVFAEGGYDLHEPHCFEGKSSDGVAGNPEGIYYPKGRQQQQHPESVCRAVMIRTMQHKLVWRTNGQSELYDLVVDPMELRNVFDGAKYATVQRDLERRLLDWQTLTGDVVPYEPGPRGFPPEWVS